MRSKTTHVTMRLTTSELTELDNIVAAFQYGSRGGAIRCGLEMLFAYHLIRETTKARIEQERRIHRPRKVSPRRIADRTDFAKPLG